MTKEVELTLEEMQDLTTQVACLESYLMGDESYLPDKDDLDIIFTLLTKMYYAKETIPEGKGYYH
jgi:hypothetical protein